MSKWLGRGVKPAVQAMVKGGLPAPEQQELVSAGCCAALRFALLRCALRAVLHMTTDSSGLLKPLQLWHSVLF